MANRSKDWLSQAKRDLEHAENDLKNEFYEWACFSAQQASEKAVKAVFYKLNADAWGHSVTALLQELAKHFPVGEALIKAAKNLDKFYIPPRYPNGFDTGKPADYFTEEDAQGAIKHAQQIIVFCEDNLSEGQRDSSADSSSSAGAQEKS
jgi:HEPN domain-containing protein